MSSELSRALLADHFIHEIGKQELRPPIYNSSVLVHQSGWHTERYLNLYYDDRTPYPLLLLMNSKESVIYLSLTKEKNLVKEMFRKYWKDPTFLNKRSNLFFKYATKVDQWYHSWNYKKLNSCQEKEPLSEFKQFLDVTWHMNAIPFFSIYFDKSVAEELISEFKLKIDSERLDYLWEHAQNLPAHSFEKKRRLYLLSLISQGDSWDKIGEKCQYFKTAYDRVYSVSDVQKELKKEYSSISAAKAKEIIEDENKALLPRRRANQEWLNSLSEPERKISYFIQYLIDLRDTRKDYLMKAVTSFYRMGEYLFEKAGLSKDLIMVVSTEELTRGSDFFVENKEHIEERKNGMSLLVHYNAEQEVEYGPVDDNKQRIDQFYLGDRNQGELLLRGQPASSGMIVGRVRIVKNVEKDKFLNGEILVTGMTRPEFVPLMGKAAGIITDEGGVTCHAAIVSREMRKPCVIGTKVATFVLHDGDLVEVNGSKGIVKILKKK
ncbi:MAG: PEP-utilizing enzyme [Candidatus Woesearchaeota archaeon]